MRLVAAGAYSATPDLLAGLKVGGRREENSCKGRRKGMREGGGRGEGKGKDPNV